jgi:hypothetical protein
VNILKKPKDGGLFPQQILLVTLHQRSMPSLISWIFMESGEKYAGKRLYLTKTKEEKNSPVIDQIRRRESCPVDEEYMKQNRFLVHFRIDKVLPLIGDKE